MEKLSLSTDSETRQRVKMTGWKDGLRARAKDLGSVPNAHMVAHNHP